MHGDSAARRKNLAGGRGSGCAVLVTSCREPAASSPDRSSRAPLQAPASGSPAAPALLPGGTGRSSRRCTGRGAAGLGAATRSHFLTPTPEHRCHHPEESVLVRWGSVTSPHPGEPQLCPHRFPRVLQIPWAAFGERGLGRIRTPSVLEKAKAKAKPLVGAAP